MKSLHKILAVLCLISFLAALSPASAATAPKKLTCCQQAKANKKTCTHNCCINAHKKGESCTRCNPNKEDIEKPDTKTTTKK